MKPMYDIMERVKSGNKIIGMVAAGLRDDGKVAVGWSAVKAGSNDEYNEAKAIMEVESRIQNAEKKANDPRTDNIFRKLKKNNLEMYAAIHAMQDRAERYYQNPNGTWREVISLMPSEVAEMA